MTAGWEARRPGEMTTIYLGRVLDDYLELPDMARRAREGHFDDFFAPPDIADGFELIHLCEELNRVARKTNRVKRLRIREVVSAVKDGEFDATPDESARWEASVEGQRALSDPKAVAMAQAVLDRAQDPQVVADALATVEKLIGSDDV